MMISVIVPVYKVEKYLHRCVDSILSQSFTDFKLILVDDGSPDDCGKICDDYAKKDNRISVIHKENGGLSSARNAGLDWVFANSKSEYVTFIDSDDWVDTDYLRALLDGIKNTASSVSACKFQEVSDDNCEKSFELNTLIYSGERFCVEQWVYSNAAWAKLIPISCFENLRFPEGKIHEDAFVMYKILLPCDRLAFIDAPLYCYNIGNDGSILRRPWTPERLVLLDAIEERIDYCIKNGYYDYLDTEIEEYIKTIRFYLYKIDKSGYQEYKKSIIIKLRKSLKKKCFNKKYPWRKNMDIYELAYPKTTKVLSIASRIKRKFKKG